MMMLLGHDLPSGSAEGGADGLSLVGHCTVVTFFKRSQSRFCGLA
jgi:hypothetical protein